MTDAVYEPAAPTPASQIAPVRGLRLVVADMDGTLLDGEGRLPARLPEVMSAMRERGVMLAPASGRQLANLRATFGALLEGGPIIAENGTYVVVGEEEVLIDTVGGGEAVTAVRTTRELEQEGQDVGAVIATRHCAYVDRADTRFTDQCARYYESLAVVDDLLDLPLEDVIKVAVYSFGDIEREAAPRLTAALPGNQVVVSGAHWTDIMSLTASKGHALAALQQRFGITPEETAVFGDYLNDLELYPYSGPSFAMANAHPRVREAARYIAPANTEDGVLRSVELLLGLAG